MRLFHAVQCTFIQPLAAYFAFSLPINDNKVVRSLLPPEPFVIVCLLTIDPAIWSEFPNLARLCGADVEIFI